RRQRSEDQPFRQSAHATSSAGKRPRPDITLTKRGTPSEIAACLPDNHPRRGAELEAGCSHRPMNGGFMVVVLPDLGDLFQGRAPVRDVAVADELGWTFRKEILIAAEIAEPDR